MYTYTLLAVFVVCFALVVVMAYKKHLPAPKILAILALVLLCATLLFNTYLTALPIVLYNEKALLGLRIGTIPVEDFSYVVVVALLVPVIYERFHHEKPNPKK